MHARTLDAGAMHHHLAARQSIHSRILSMHNCRTLRFVTAVTLGAAVFAGFAACASPRTEANVAQALNDAANEIGGLKSDLANLQTEMDSLRMTVAKQDTLISRIMAVNNIPR
jgi:hypothetical protein